VVRRRRSGDRELITLKGYRLLQQAQVVIYAGSLINTELLAYCPPQAECHDSAALHLEQILDLMEAGVKAGKTVVRLQTGTSRCTARCASRAKS
jgi:precorrin-4/cobalt-precorrin-4 C11-methyltransferase